MGSPTDKKIQVHDGPNREEWRDMEKLQPLAKVA